MFLITFAAGKCRIMYQALIFLHSIVRWLVLASLVYAIYKAYKGMAANAAFSKTDNTIRHGTATIAHIQLVIGIMLYMQSPVIKYFWGHFNEARHSIDNTFFGVIHITLMLAAITVVTIGSALAKRRTGDRQKFNTMLAWYSAALLIIFIAIPWPFSPLAARPYFR